MNTFRVLWRNNGLSIVLISIFLILWLGQALMGCSEYNEDREQLGENKVSFWQYLATPHFLEATMENWESEFLQMGAFVVLTVSLFQKGSAESKDPSKREPEEEDPRDHKNSPLAPWPVRHGGLALWVYERSLGLAFSILFLGSTFLHALGGARLYNEEQVALGKEVISFAGYFGTSRFWFESFQNWQSEFLAIASMVIFTIYLRQRGSPESKPVATPHAENGE